MAIPKNFVSRYLERSKNLTFMGVKIQDLTMDELIACVVYSLESEKKYSTLHSNQFNLLDDIKILRRGF